MPYQKIPTLETLWMTFADTLQHLAQINQTSFSDIKKLMTAVSVIDLSLHEIYRHTEDVHRLTDQLMELRKTQTPGADECCQCWLAVLKERNHIPLVIKHHQLMDAECDFRFSLQQMEESEPCGFKAVEVLDQNNVSQVNAAITAIHRLECLAEGISFAKLPLMQDKVLSALLESKEMVCVIAKDQRDQIVGYCWGLFLQGIPINQTQKANVFWVMDMAKDPDFYDKKIKVGDQLREMMFSQLKAKKDCDFVGYQHLLHHPFHTRIIGKTQDDEEEIYFQGEKFSGKTAVKYSDSLLKPMRAHFIKTRKDLPDYPDFFYRIGCFVWLAEK